MSLPPIHHRTFSTSPPPPQANSLLSNARAVGGATTSAQRRGAVQRHHGETAADFAPHPNERQRRLIQMNKANASGAGRLRTTTGAAAASGNTIRVLHSDIERGAWSMIERGLLPANFDMGLIMEGPKRGGVQSSPLQCAPVRIHEHDEQFVRRETATGPATGGGYTAVKYDVKALEDLPHDRHQFMEALAARRALQALEPTPAMKLAARTAAGRRNLLLKGQQQSQQQQQDPAKTKDGGAGGDQQQQLRTLLTQEEQDYLAAKQREDTRTYEQLLDKFSLHDFIIRKGVTLRNTPEFNSFHRSNVQKWSAVNDVILHLERLLFETAVPVANIDGNRVVELATVDNGVCTREQLLSCISNREEIEPLVTSMSHRFLFAPKRFDLAAAVIQAAFRGFRQFKQYKLLHAANAAAVKIQQQYAVHREHKATQRKITLSRQELLDGWMRLQEKFVKEWQTISRSGRVVVHLPSVSVGSEHRVPVFGEYFQRQILPRLASLADPSIEYMVMVSPVKPEEDTVNYFLNALASAGVENLEGRVSTLVPEIVTATDTAQSGGMPRRSRVKLPSLTLTKLVLCSAHVMRKLRAAVRGRTAYMVCDVVTEDEQFLAAKLNIPILGCASPHTSMQLSTKSGGRAVLANADVNIPVGAVGIRTPDELYLALSKLIVENPTTLRWIIKLDAESGGRGIAVLDTKRIRSYDEVVKLFDLQHPNQIQQQQFASPGASSPPAHSSSATPPTIGAATAVAAKIYGELKDVAARRIKISHSAAYPDWQSYTAAMKKMTCVIEAAPNDIIGSPTAHLFIPPAPHLEPHLIGIQQQIVSPLTFTSLGVVYPQTCVPDAAIVDASLNAAQVLRRAGLCGYVTVDFVVFRKGGAPPAISAANASQKQQQPQSVGQQKKALRMWTVGVRPCITINSSIHELACVLRREHLTPDMSFRSSGRPPFCYSYTGVIYHPHISALRHSTFFQIARQRGLSLEAESMKEFAEVCAIAAANGEIIMGGTVFHLIDSLLCGAVGALFLAPTAARCAEYFVRFTELLHQQLSAENALLDDPRGNLLHLLASARTFTVMYGLQKKPATVTTATGAAGAVSSSSLSAASVLSRSVKK